MPRPYLDHLFNCTISCGIFSPLSLISLFPSLPLRLSPSLHLTFAFHPPLDEDDWKEVCQSVGGLSANWRKLARHLGLDANSIDTIAHENTLSMNECLSQALIYWLRCNYNVRRNGYPSWRTLAKAVKPLNGLLFNDIKKAHPSKLDICHHVFL